MTQEWTEEKLTGRMKSYLESMGHSLTSYELDVLMGFVKSATYLKGNKELPDIHTAMGNLILPDQAQQDMLKPPYNYKSTEEWKK